MSQRFVFKPHATAENLENALATPNGAIALEAMSTSFSSLTEMLLLHTQGVGHGTVVHLPNNQNLTFVNISKQVFEEAAYYVSESLGFKI